MNALAFAARPRPPLPRARPALRRRRPKVALPPRAAAASPPLRHGRCGGRGRDGRPPLAAGLRGLQGGRPRQDVLAEEVERGGHVELGRGVRHLRHLPGAGHG